MSSRLRRTGRLAAAVRMMAVIVADCTPAPWESAEYRCLECSPRGAIAVAKIGVIAAG